MQSVNSTSRNWGAGARCVSASKKVRVLLLMLFAVFTASFAPRAHAATPLQECQALRRHGRAAEARSCFTRLLSAPDPYLRAEGFWGLEQYTDARDEFQAAIKAQPQNPEYRVRFGRMLLERFNRQDAASLFNEALAIRKDYAPALVGLALIASEQFESRAVELAQKALESDPKLLEAQELLARFALEDNNPQKAMQEADKALAMSSEALDAMAIRATIDWMDGKQQSPWMDRILKINPSYGEAYATAGYFFVINRRYEEGIDFYRKAIALNPQLWSARSELGVNLMRLGLEKEAREQLELCYNNGYRNAATVNTLRLMDSYKNFLTYKSANTIVRLHRKEAELLRPYVESELKRAIATYEKKYQMKLERPVQVEMYPDHEDFAVRTMGMPGLGALGVTFGYVVAMDSPSGRKPGSFHWDSTMWHELSHVFVLAATKHLAPRWFGEGMAVYEETAASPDWGDRLDPQVILAMRDKKLLPIAELDRGFVRPRYPSQVVVSYFQAGRICEYIASKWGYQKLLEMMHAFGAGKSTPEVIQQNLGMAPEAFDKEFLAWLDTRYKPTVDHFEEWRKRIQTVAASAKAKNYDEVIREGTAIRDMYPEYVEDGSVYEFLADAYLAKGNKAAAMSELERYSKIGGRSPYLIKKLASLQEEAGKKREAAENLSRLLYVYPVQDEELHQRLGNLWMDLGATDKAILEYQSVLALHPADQAQAHYNLARALQAAKRIPEAKEHVLLSLEAAPNYRPAQKMLLDLTQ
jgi:tetratricopeptide (TPR) repeat protein